MSTNKISDLELMRMVLHAAQAAVDEVNREYGMTVAYPPQNIRIIR